MTSDTLEKAEPNRYIVTDRSESGHRCFEATVVDLCKPSQWFKGKFEQVCECFEPEDAAKIAQALNADYNHQQIIDRLKNELAMAQSLLAESEEAKNAAIQGWKKLNDAIQELQIKHLDNHHGDVYHAMQYLDVKFGFKHYKLFEATKS